VPAPAAVLRLGGRLFTCRVVRRLSTFRVLLEGGGSRIVGLLRNTGRLEDVIYPGSEVVCLERQTPSATCLIVGKALGDTATILDTRLQEEAFAAAVGGGLIPWLAGWRIAGRGLRVSRSRLDFAIEGPQGMRGALELKSAEYYDPRDRSAQYPDTPSPRGRRHVAHLAELASRGYRAVIVFMVSHPLAMFFRPSSRDPEFARLLSKAVKRGVEARAVKTYLDVTTGSIMLADPDLEVRLE